MIHKAIHSLEKFLGVRFSLCTDRKEKDFFTSVMAVKQDFRKSFCWHFPASDLFSVLLASSSIGHQIFMVICGSTAGDR